MGEKTSPSEETGERLSSAFHLFPLFKRQRVCSLTSAYPFIKYIPIAASHYAAAPRCTGLNNRTSSDSIFGLIGSLPAEERKTAGRKCRAVPDTAITGSGDNDTPVQPQSERDSVFQRKAVAGNGGSRQRTCRG